MKLKHFALFCKGHYAWPKANKEHDEQMWECVRLALCADDYQPETRHDILHIIVSNVTEFTNDDKERFVLELTNAISPYACYNIGYFTRDFFLAKGYTKRVKYDYQTALLYFYIHKVRFMHANVIDGLPKPDPKILELATV